MDLKNSIQKTVPTRPSYVPDFLITWLKLLYVSANRFNTKRIMCVKVNQDNEILFRSMDGLTTNTVKENVAIVDIGDTGEDMGHKGMEVKIAFPMSHNTLTIAEEYIK
jgi:hypothetical protein